MKNPFVKNDNRALVVTLAAGTATAGALAYLYLTNNGAATRNSIAHKLKDEAKSFISGIISDKTGIRKKTVKHVADHVVK